MAGVKHTFSTAIADDASAQAAGMVLPSHWNDDHLLSDVATETDRNALSAKLVSAVNAVSNALSSEIVDRISADTVLAAAVDVVSNAVSVEISNRISADNALSSRVDTVSNKVSALSVAIDVVSAAAANALSVANAASNKASALSVAIDVVSNAASNALSVANAVSNKASALSVVIAANSAQMTSADNAISNAVSIVSVAAANALSVANAASNKASALSVVIAANSAQMTSANNAISNAVSIVSVAAANAASIANAVSNRLSTWTLDNLVGVSVPLPTSSQVLKYNSAISKWVAATDETGGGGGGSVTSNELSAAAAGLSNRVDSVANAVSVVSQALSALSNQNSVDHASIINRLSGLSGQVTSADNAISNAVSIVSAAQAVTSAAVTSVNAVLSNLTSAHNAVSNAASNALSVANAASNKASALSVVIAANSAQMTSADNAISNAVSVVSVAAANALSVANAASVVAADALSKANAVSNTLSGWTVSDLADTSLNAITSGQVMKWNATAGKWIPADDVGGLGGASVTSAEYQSLVDRVSANSGTGGAASVTSNELSAVSANAQSNLNLRAPWLDAEYRILSNTKSTAGSALVDISGLVLTVAANETWEVDGMLLFSTSATTVGLRFGASVPPLSTPRAFIISRMSGAQSAGIIGGAGLFQVSGNSVLASVAGVGPAAGAFPVTMKAIFNVASAGTFRLMYGGIASTAASPVHILPGSYFKAFRIK